jgi:hypothetical protein
MTGSTFASIFLRPVLPPMVLGAIALVLVALAILSYLRADSGGRAAWIRFALLGMRVAAILALTALLLGPSVIPPTSEREEKPQLTVLIDVSESMRTGDCGERDRFAAMRDTWLDAASLDRLAAVAELDVRLVGEVSEAVGRSVLDRMPSDAAMSRETNLLKAIGESLGAAAVNAGDGHRILLLSDGRDTSGSSPSPTIELARSRGVPIDTACFGAAVVRRDLALQAAGTQEFLYAEEEGSLIVRLHQTGLALSDATVDCAVEGPEGPTTTTHVLDMRGRTIGQIEIPIRHAKPGQYQYVLRVANRPEELDTNNNLQTLFIDVSKAKAHVLLLEGLPSWDMKFIAQALRKDQRIELTQVSRLSNTRTEVIVSGAQPSSGAASSAKPSGTSEAARILAAESLEKFDVFILGKGIDRFGSPELAAAIRDRVAERGAGVIFARGAAYPSSADSFAAAFGPIEPVEFARAGVAPLKNVRVALSASAATMPWLGTDRLGVDLAASSDQLAPWPLLHRVDTVKPGTIVLARALAAAESVEGADDERNAPAIVSMRIGRGTSVALLGEGIWKWALVDSDRDRFEGVYERCMQGLVRWIASGGDSRPGQEVTLRLSTQSARLDDAVGVEVLLDRAIEVMPTEVKLTHPDGTSELLPLSSTQATPLRLTSSFRPTKPGAFLVTLDTPGVEPERQQRYVSVFDPSVERINTSADPLGMRTLSERTGGRVFGPNEAASYPNHVRRHRFATIASQEATWVWNRFPILLMLCTWLGLEWILRRRAGLP